MSALSSIQHRAWSLVWELPCPHMGKGLSSAGPWGVQQAPPPPITLPWPCPRIKDSFRGHRSSPGSGARRYDTQSHTTCVPLFFFFFFKLKQQSGNCPNPSGRRPWAVFLQKNIFFLFFFFLNNTKSKSTAPVEPVPKESELDSSPSTSLSRDLGPVPLDPSLSRGRGSPPAGP